jgi:hypothetical protein
MRRSARKWGRNPLQTLTWPPGAGVPCRPGPGALEGARRRALSETGDRRRGNHDRDPSGHLDGALALTTCALLHPNGNAGRSGGPNGSSRAQSTLAYIPVGDRYTRRSEETSAFRAPQAAQ